MVENKSLFDVQWKKYNKFKNLNKALMNIKYDKKSIIKK